jgi:L-amino acid N-acyltransferase YncA
MSTKILIRKANAQDSRFLLKIHNESVKKKFINSIIIKKKDINIWNKWFKKKNKLKNYVLYIGIHKKNKKLGFVSFSEIDKNIFEVRIGILSIFYGKGLGTLFLKKTLQKFIKKKKPKKIISFVKKFNIRSAKCFLKNGFKKKNISTKKINLKSFNPKTENSYVLIK